MKRTFNSLISISLCLILVVMSCKISLADSVKEEHHQKNCAHENTHTKNRSGIFSLDDVEHFYKHWINTICNACDAIVDQDILSIIYEEHEYITTDLGHVKYTHVLKDTCPTCGHTKTRSISCSGPPCPVYI